MKTLIVVFVFITGAGCATASPIDFLIPTPVMPITTNYLGHITPPKVNRLFHSLRDTKNETALLEVRKVELDALYQVAKVGNGVIIETFDPISTAVWASLLAVAAGAGLAIPAPGTRARIQLAGEKDPAEFAKTK